MRVFGLILLVILGAIVSLRGATSDGVQPLSRIAIHKTVFALDDRAYIKAYPPVLGLKVIFSFVSLAVFGL